MPETDDELEFELITNPNQLGSAPPMRNMPVQLPDWKTQSGKAARFLVWELSAADYIEYIESGRIYKDGAVKRYDLRDEDIRLVAHTVRDQHGNRIWKSTEAAKAQLGPLGKSSIDLLLKAANDINSVRNEDTEGNSDGTPKDSSPTT
jgi:hypothetical protein